nr:NAD(P)H-dependent oxidoreductase [Aliamphritea spongicola]
MSNILIINAHHPYPFAEGSLNSALVRLAEEILHSKGHHTRVVDISAGWDVDQELENHLWADTIIVQSPVNWMSVPWTFKNTWTKSTPRA